MRYILNRAFASFLVADHTLNRHTVQANTIRVNLKDIEMGEVIDTGGSGAVISYWYAPRRRVSATKQTLTRTYQAMLTGGNACARR